MEQEKEIELDGCIAYWNFERGYGFITTDELDADVFIHIKNIRGMLRPYEGAKVQFGYTENERGYTATFCRILIEGDSDESD